MNEHISTIAARREPTAASNAFGGPLERLDCLANPEITLQGQFTVLDGISMAMSSGGRIPDSIIF